MLLRGYPTAERPIARRVVAVEAQKGAIALLMLVLLTGGSSLVLVNLLNGAHSFDVAEDRARRLGKAREALLAYAVSYIDLYGPRGAGPGHLPCPDTDSDTVAKATDDWRRDGPNPPCGAAAVAIGRLPRHISLPEHRYNFHTEPEQRLWYAVSTDFINNPVNRVVNPASRGTLQIDGVDDVVAVIIDPDEASPDQRRRLEDPQAYRAFASIGASTRGVPVRAGVSAGNERLILIGMHSLRQAVVRRVALWLRERYSITALARCAAQASASEDTSPCLPYAFDCGADASLQWLIDDSHRCSPATEGVHKTRPHGRKIRPQDGRADTDGADPARALMEEVPLQAHWYVRNRWPEHAQLTIAPVCKSLALEACRFRIAEPRTEGREIHVELVPLEHPGS